MLNLIQGKLVIANPTNLTSSLREAAVLQRSNPNIVTFMDYFVATKVSPRNDVSVFNNKLLQSYGKSQGGKPITIGYNPTNQQYFSFSNKGSNNSGSIYDAISGSTQGKYPSDFLQNIACPISTSSGTPKPPPPPPLPKPPSGPSGGSAAGGQPLYSFNAAGSGEIALPLELLGKPPPPLSVPPDIPASSKSAAESTEFKWTEEGMAKLLAASQTKDIVNSGAFGARNDGATPISNRQATSDNVPNFSSIDYNQPFDYSMLFLNKDEQLKQHQALSAEDRILPIYDDISSLIKDKPAGLQDNMIPFLSDFAYKTDSSAVGKVDNQAAASLNINVVGSAQASAIGAVGATELSLPVFEVLILKYGPKVAQGFAKFAIKNGARFIPGIGIAMIAGDVHDAAYTVYDIYNRLATAETVAGTIHEARGDSTQVKEQKATVKAQITSAVIEKTTGLDRCERLKALTVDELVQEFTDTADDLVPNILDQHLPPVWNGENIIGILKHNAAHNLNKIHRIECKDLRLESEIHWRDKGELTDEQLGTPGGTKGSVRLDFITDTINHPELPEIVYDLKFGKQGITNSQLQKWQKHTLATIFKEVRPTNQGGITQIFPKENQ